MKRRGSVLVSVLIASSLLLGLGTVVSATVVNTTKLNQRYSENIDLELAAKSALNYGIDYLTKNYKTITDEGFNRDGILDDEQDNITKSIVISKSGNEFTVIGKAKLNRNSEISAEESTVIKIDNDNNNNDNSSNNENDETTEPSEGNGISPINFLNVTNNIYLGELTNNIVSKVAFGGIIEKGWGINEVPASIEELKGTTSTLKNNTISAFRSSLKIEDFSETEESIDKNNFEELIVDKSHDNIVNINLNNDIRKVSNVIDVGGKEINIKLDNSILFIEGGILKSRKIDINLDNNSKLIIYGNIECPSGTIDLTLNGSFLDVDNINASGNISITGKSSWLNVDNSIESTANAITINFDNTLQGSNYTSLINVKENISASNQNELNLKNGSKAQVGDSFIASGNWAKISLFNDSTLNINGVIEANNLIDIDLSSSSMASGDMNFTNDYSKGSIKISLDESNLIQGGIDANDVQAEKISDSLLIVSKDIKAKNNYIKFDIVENSPIFINGSIYSNDFYANLNNSAFIVNGSMSKENDKTSVMNFYNKGKSFVYVFGDIRANFLNLYPIDNNKPNAKDIEPDDEVMNLLSDFVKFTKS